jgi:K+-transporting ATPase c subunit
MTESAKSTLSPSEAELNARIDERIKEALRQHNIAAAEAIRITLNKSINISLASSLQLASRGAVS